MSDRRMDAYYYDFSPTFVPSIDKVLGAVACAGKAFHHTDDWNEECSPYDDHTGATPVEWIQNAAKEAADEITALRAEVEKLRAALQDIARVTRGWEPGVWTEEEGRKYFASLFFGAQKTARAALEEKP